MEWQIKSPVYGDVIRTKVRFYHHYGIFVSPQRVIQFGLPEDPMRAGADVQVVASDIYGFLCGGELEVGVPDRQERKQLRKPSQIVSQAESRLGEGGYHILHNNCEHFVNDCVFGNPTSGWLEEARAKLRIKLGKE